MDISQAPRKKVSINDSSPQPWEETFEFQSLDISQAPRKKVSINDSSPQPRVLRVLRSDGIKKITKPKECCSCSEFSKCSDRRCECRRRGVDCDSSCGDKCNNDYFGNQLSEYNRRAHESVIDVKDKSSSTDLTPGQVNSKQGKVTLELDSDPLIYDGSNLSIGDNLTSVPSIEKVVDISFKSHSSVNGIGTTEKSPIEVSDSHDPSIESILTDREQRATDTVQSVVNVDILIPSVAPPKNTNTASTIDTLISSLETLGPVQSHPSSISNLKEPLTIPSNPYNKSPRQQDLPVSEIQTEESPAKSSYDSTVGIDRNEDCDSDATTIASDHSLSLLEVSKDGIAKVGEVYGDSIIEGCGLDMNGGGFR